MKIAFLSLFLVCLSMVSWAKDRGTPPEGPCRADVERLCKDVKRGDGRIRACLREKQAQLSAECKAKMEKAQSRTKDTQAACQADVEKLCGKVPKEGGAVAKCLRENTSKLSPACQDAFAKKKHKDGK